MQLPMENLTPWRPAATAVWLCALLAVAHCGAPIAAVPAGGGSAQQPPPFNNFMGVLAAASMPAVSAYHAVHNYTHDLPLPLLKNGLVYAGANTRLRRVVGKLLRGERVSVGVIGGSISWGHGVARGQEDWFSRLADYLRRAFPRATIAARNGCVPGTQSEFVAVCLDKFVDEDVDLVFVEFTTNDGYLDTSVNNAYAHAFERLLRKLLRFRGAPAVAIVNFLHTDARRARLPFYHTIEDHYGVLAQYYGLPWISFRDAVWQGLMSDWDGFRPSDMFVHTDLHERHPNPLGHKYLADLAVGMVQQAYMEHMLVPLAPADVAAGDAVPGPMFPHNYDSLSLACATGLDFVGAVRQDDHRDWYFVNEGTEHKPKWGYVSHVPGATLIIKVDTRDSGALPIAQLTLQQKVQLLQQHGMHAAATELQVKAAALPPVGPAPAAAAPPAVIVAPPGADGMAAVMAEAARQAAAAAAALQTGELQRLAFGERVVGGSRSAGFHLPLDARQPGATKTATGVQVVAGRRLLLQPAPQRGGAVLARQGWHATKGGGAGVSGRNSSNSSSSSVGSPSAGRLLRGAQPDNVIPPPKDAVYLKPSRDGDTESVQPAAPAPPPAAGHGDGNAPVVLQPPEGSSVLTTLGAPANSVAQADMLVWVGYLKSFRQMGMARLFCRSGCACQDALVDAWHSLPNSQTFMAKLRVTQHAECEIGVQVLPFSSTGHHKFKVSGVMISKALEYRSEDDLTESMLLGAIENAAGGGGGGAAGD